MKFSEKFSKQLKRHKKLIAMMVQQENESQAKQYHKLIPSVVVTGKELALVYADFKCESCSAEENLQFHHLIFRHVKNITDHWKYIKSTKLKFRNVYPRYKKLPLLECYKINQRNQLSFSGPLIGIHILSSFDAGILGYSIDGNSEKEVDLFTQWSSTNHLPWTIILENDLSPGSHQISFWLKSKKNSGSRGNAARIVYFLTQKP